MPWLLTTPIDTGDLDTVDYGEVKIVDHRQGSGQPKIVLMLQYGNTVDGSWVPGIAPVGKQIAYVADNDDYLELITTHMTYDGELTYQAVKRGLYEHLNAKGVIGPGSII